MRVLYIHVFVRLLCTTYRIYKLVVLDFEVSFFCCVLLQEDHDQEHKAVLCSLRHNNIYKKISKVIWQVPLLSESDIESALFSASRHIIIIFYMLFEE